MSQITITPGTITSLKAIFADSDIENVYLRAYLSKNFFDSEGVGRIGSRLDSGDFFELGVMCEVDDEGNVFYPEFQLTSTTDGTPNDAYYTFAIYDGENARSAIVAAKQKVPADRNPTTLEALFIFNQSKIVKLPDSYYTAQQVDNLLDSLPSGSVIDASVFAKGKVRLDAAPTQSNDPVAVSPNSPILGSLQDQIDEISSGSVPDATEAVKGKVQMSKAGSATALAVNEAFVTEGKKSFYAADYALVSPNPLQAAANAASAASSEVIVSDVMTLTSAVDTQKNVPIKFTGKGRIVASNTSVKIGLLGENANRQIFAATGTNGKVTLGKAAANSVNLAWWTGAVPGADVTKEMQQAVESLTNNNGSTLELPSGEINFAVNTITIPSGAVFKGRGSNPNTNSGATILKPIVPNGTIGWKLLKIAGNTRNVFLADMTIEGTGTSDGDAVLIEGSQLAGQATVGVYFGNTTIKDFNVGVNLKSLDGSFNVEQVTFGENSQILNCNSAFKCDSNNTSVNFYSTYFDAADGGTVLDMIRCGKVNVYGANGVNINASGGGTFLHLKGDYLAVNLYGCQDEGLANFLIVDVSKSTDAINIHGGLIQSKIRLNKTCILNTYGVRMSANTITDTLAAAAIHNSYGDTFTGVNDDPAYAHILGQPFLAANGIALSLAKHTAFVNGSYSYPNIYGSSGDRTNRQAQFSEIVLNEQYFGSLERAAFTIATNNDSRIALGIGKAGSNGKSDPNYTYGIKRNVDGKLHFTSGSSETQEGYVFDAPITANGVLLTGGSGGGGTSGTSSYTYIAYAADATGGNFAVTPSSARDYVAFKATNTAIGTPSASDFTGLWKKYKGDQGAAGSGGGAAIVIKDSAEYASLEAAKLAIGTQPTILVLSSDLSCTSLVKIPTALFLLDGGGRIVKGTGGKVEFLGVGLANPLAPRPYFSGFTYTKPTQSDLPAAKVAGDVTWTGAKTPAAICTAIFDNPTLSEKINMCDRAFLDKPIEIVALPGDLHEQVSLHEKTLLTFTPGNYTNSYDIPNRAYSPNFWMYDDVRVRGAGIGQTVINEVPSNAPSSVTIFQAISVFYAYTPELTQTQGELLSTNRNIHLSDFTIQGAPNLNTQQNDPSINLCNTHTGSVERVHLRGVNGFATYCGTANKFGTYAKDITFRNNIYENCGSQYAGGINVDGFYLLNNLFTIDKPAPTGEASYSNFIDMEPGDYKDRINNVIIDGNTMISTARPMPNQSFGTIVIQATATPKCKNVRITNNKIIGNFTGGGYTLNGGIDARGVENLIIKNNEVSGIYGAGVVVTGCSLGEISHTTSTETAGMKIIGSHDLVVKDNVFPKNAKVSTSDEYFKIREEQLSITLDGAATSGGVSKLFFDRSGRTIFDYWVGKKFYISGAGINAGVYTIVSTNFDTGVDRGGVVNNWNDGEAVVSPNTLGTATGAVTLESRFEGDNQFIDNVNAEYVFNPYTNAIPVDNVNVNQKVKTIPGNYTLLRSDNGKTLVFTGASEQIVTVPANIKSGFEAEFVQSGAGKVKFVGAGSVNILHELDHNQTKGAKSIAELRTISLNNWILTGGTAGDTVLPSVHKIDAGRTGGDTINGYEQDTFRTPTQTPGAQPSQYSAEGAPNNSYAGIPPSAVFNACIYALPGGADAVWTIPGHTASAPVTIIIDMLSPSDGSNWTAQVLINNVSVETNIDAVARSGGARNAFRLTYQATANSLGNVLVAVRSLTNYPLVAAIETR